MGDGITQANSPAAMLRAKFLKAALESGASPSLSRSPTADITGSSLNWSSETGEVQRAYLEQLLESTPEAISILDTNYRVVRINSEFTRLFGYSPAEATGRVVMDLIVPPELQAQSNEMNRALDAGQKIRVETQRRRKNGSRVDVSIAETPVNFAGRAVALYAIYREISQEERTQALNEEALRSSEARYRSLVDSAVYGIYRCDTEGRFRDANPALVAMLGYDSAEQVLDLHPDQDVFLRPEELARLIREGNSKGKVDNLEVKWKRKDGTILTVRLSGRSVSNGDESGMLELIAEDVTEKRVLEDQFRQAQKMEAVGRLAGGVAHDFNNLLMVISGYTEVLLDALDATSPLHSRVEAIQQAADRATTLTRQLLAFSRKQLLELKVVDVNAIVQDMERLLRPLIGENIELVTRLEQNVGRTRADAGQLEQVIMNLVVNGKDAMPNGGKITIQTANAELDDSYRREHTYIQPGPYIVLLVSDTGCGMDKETQSRIFEPFFTTKEKGKGTGLGLSTVYGIIKQSGGYVFAQSELGLGTTFRIYLPRVEGAAEPMESTKTTSGVLEGTETVLLVEDEESVRQLVAETLSTRGYKVLEAENGDDALKLAAATSDTIHLMITDVVMPGISGRELARELIKTRPQTKVLFLSGYSEDAVVHQGVLEPDTAFLQKPFTLQHLARKVREILRA